MKRHILIAMLGAAALPALADYGINFPDGTLQTATNPARYLNGVAVSSGSLPVQTVNIGQVAGGELFIDKTSQCVVLMAGATTQIEFKWEGNWMNSYVYLDKANDGNFNANLTADNLPTADSDIMSFSNLSNKNSVGGEAVDSRNIIGNTMLLPEFTTPDVKPGLYRMRFKVDFSNVDPGGATEDQAGKGNSIAQRGGTIADVMALIIEPTSSLADVVLTAEHGSLTLSDLSEGQFTVNATADDNFFFNGVNLINELAAPEGVTFADAAIAKSVKTFMSQTDQVTLGINELYGSSTINGLFVGASDKAGIYEYASEYDGEKADNQGITSLTLNGGEMQNVKAATRHFFTNRAFNLPVGTGVKLQAAYSGSAKEFKVYVDVDQTGEFGAPLASGESLAKIGEVKLPASLKAGVYRARIEAVGDCEVDFLLNVYNPTASYRSGALNGYIMAADGSVVAETMPTFKALGLQVLPTLPGFEVDTVIVRHGQNLTGPEFVAGNQQWTDAVLPISAGGAVTIPAELINGDIIVYALFSATESSEWIKVWGDEFNTNTIDSKRWTYNPRYGGAWNRFIALSAQGREKVNVMDNGYYNSWCIPTPDDLKTAENNVAMISGALISSGRFQVCYGKVEARAKTNPFVGNFPAFWMMPAYSELGEYKLNGWPNDGEIDIWEQINTQQAAHSTIHSGWTGWSSYNKWPAPKQKSPASTKQVASNPGEWHVYALEWDAEELRFYVDGKQTFSYKNQHYTEADSPYYFTEKVTWPFDKQFYVIVNQSVGNGSWAANPDTKHEYLTQFDYVRVYQKKGVGNNMNMLGTNGDDPDFYKPATNNAFSGESGIRDIEVQEVTATGVPQYFDLSGRRVNPGSVRAGVYIEQIGTQTQKVIIR